MSKIFLLGKNGMLGRAIRQNYELRITNYECISWSKDDLDITNKHAVFAQITQLKPTIVINATGYTNVDGAEIEREQALAVNAKGVGYLAEACAEIGAALFHFSTDYIFDGTEPHGYKEDEEEHINPLNVYGQSKLEGELRIKNYELRITNKEWKYFIIRTSWLYGPGGKNFVDTLLERAKGGQREFKVVNDQFGKPTYTADLAERVVWMVEQFEELESGIYHCTNEITNYELRITNYETAAGISWYDFACEIFKQAHQLGIIKTLPIVTPCTTAEFPRPAKRSQYSALINTKLPPLREWSEALREYLKNSLGH